MNKSCNMGRAIAFPPTCMTCTFIASIASLSLSLNFSFQLLYWPVGILLSEALLSELALESESDLPAIPVLFINRGSA